MAKRVILKPGQHSHRCDGCKTIWAHTCREAENAVGDSAHRCPNCGAEQYWIHRNYGDKRAQRVTNKMRAQLRVRELLAHILGGPTPS